MEAPVDVSEPSTSEVASMTSKPHVRPLGPTFRFAQRAYMDVEKSSLPGNDAGLQKRVLEGVSLSEAALLAVERECIFSPNELGEDINTGDIKYLLLPFYRGELLLRVADQPKRVATLHEALKSLRGFIADQERLELLASEAKSWQHDTAVDASAGDPAAVRTHKIARIKAKKAARERLELVQSQLEKRRSADDNDDNDDDDELEREQHLLLLKDAVFTTVDSIRSSAQELDMLQQIEKMRLPDGSLPPKPSLENEDPSFGLQMLSLLPPPGGAPSGAGADARIGGVTSQASGPLGLVTVDPTRDVSSRLSYATAMRQIHTGEIPGLYTFSVEEGMRMEEAERAMAEAARMDEMSQRADARVAVKKEREQGNDEEDEEERQKLIRQDEFREMNKRGAGNRKNRS